MREGHGYGKSTGEEGFDRRDPRIARRRREGASANKYYVALHKLDELLDAIRPLEIIEATVSPTERASAQTQPSAAVEPQGEEVKTWSGVVQETVGEPSWQPAPAEASGDALRAS
jgi:hypothetical protein